MWFGVHLSQLQFGAKRSNRDEKNVRFDVKFYCPTNIKKQMLGCEKTKMVITKVYPHHFFASVLVSLEDSQLVIHLRLHAIGTFFA